jgi:DNA-binding response OmpR family regulator
MSAIPNFEYKSLQNGADHFITKPFEFPEDVLLKTEELVRKYYS